MNYATILSYDNPNLKKNKCIYWHCVFSDMEMNFEKKYVAVGLISCGKSCIFVIPHFPPNFLAYKA